MLQVAGILTGDVPLIGSSLDSDVIIEPVRGPLIPGMMAVKAAAKAAGAYGCTISGAGPTAVAIVDSAEKGQKVGEAGRGRGRGQWECMAAPYAAPAT